MTPFCRSMFRNVVAALNEALDITMHLKPLSSHFQVKTYHQNDKKPCDKSVKINPIGLAG